MNIAYEAATADINDKNMIDYFHLDKYGVTAVNYNRDLEIFPVLKEILFKITNENVYYSPTDMGVNVIISGGMGGGAVDIFNEKNIEVVVGASGDSTDIVKAYLKGELESTGSVCHEHSHHDECESHD